MKTTSLWSTLPVIIATLSAPALAQTAGMLSFQAQLKDNGAAFNGTVTLQFRVFDAESAGNLVDLNGDGSVIDAVGEDAIEVAGVQVTDSLLATKWGPISPKAFDGADRWVEVRVDGEILSRFEIVTPPATAEQLSTPGGEAVANTTDDGNLGVGTDQPTAKFEIKGNPPVLRTGMIAAAMDSPFVQGVGTAFNSEIERGDLIYVTIPTTQTRMVTQITNNGLLTVESPFVPEIPAQAFSVIKPAAVLSFDPTFCGSCETSALFITGDGRVGIGGNRVPMADLDVFGVAKAISMETDTLYADVINVNDLTGPWDSNNRLRIGDIQIVWGQYQSNASGGFPFTSFGTSFLDNNYEVVLTPETLAGARFAIVREKTSLGFYAQSYGTNDLRSGTIGSYIAIGRWR